MNAVVKTRQGAVRGGFADGVHTLKGIPYAAPPFGACRLQPRNQVLRLTSVWAALAVASSAAGANNCETIRAQIDAKIRAAGVAHYTLTTIDTDAVANGKVVGTCDRGKKKIVYLQGKSPAGASTDAASPGRRPDTTKPGKEAILTECKDGSVSVGGECKK